MSAQILADLSAPLVALRLLSMEFGHLPAPTVAVSPIYPDLLELSFHCGVADFEVWREALSIDPGDVVHRVHRDGTTGALNVHGNFGGARVRLVGYTTLAVADGTLAGVGAS
ncbi:hypothetical protein V1460_34420 [Streptomyces sp. SCSIO 30461]|uniref:hypothetical protein n=1 Tax=Streptomyces sp. SCSIO 30461 TaxID=3118085 RepID=UPI0030D3691A